MPQESSPSQTPHPATALAAYAEQLVRGRRVAVLGDATLGLGERLLERGARSVHALDPVPTRLAQALARSTARGGLKPVFAGLAEEQGVRDGAFDVVIVPDLSAFADAEGLVRRLRRLLPSTGVAVIAAPNPDAERWLLPPSANLGRALGYYDLFDLVTASFTEVRMLGQAPFVGYALVDFSAEEPDVSVDTSSLDEPELAEWYVVVASERRVNVDPYALVEIPLADVARAGGSNRAAEEEEDDEDDGEDEPGDPITLMPPRPPREAKIDPRVSDLTAQLTEAKARSAVLSAEVERLREHASAEARAERARDQLAVRVAELEVELAGRDARLRELDGRFAVEAKRAGELATRLASGAAAVARVSELEAKLAEIEPPTLRSKESAAKLAAMEQKLAAANTRALEAEGREKDLLVRIREIEARAQAAAAGTRTAEGQRDGVRRELDAARAEIEAARVARETSRQALARAEARAEALAAVEARAEASARVQAEALADAEARAEALVRELDAARAAPADDEALVREVAALEARLVERGREVAELRRQLREGERLGRELLFDLEDARAVRPSAATGGGAPQGTNGAGGRAGSAGASEDLAERAARVEADLLAASWRVAQLERELSSRAAPKADPESVRVTQLEKALVIAHRELAELRGPEAEVSLRVEDAVLREQIEAARGGLSARDTP